ncbi:hypothetical protein B0H10DRAFT_190268 [Mycena sp. CBHHK59/15]|nr:hypothetical protein B0H10DRAFT_190268 [Mycena sp. CBHHK59/15]
MFTSDYGFSNATTSYGSSSNFSADAAVFFTPQNNTFYDGSSCDLSAFFTNVSMSAEIPMGFEDLFIPTAFEATSPGADHDYNWSAMTPADELPTLPAPPASSPSLSGSRERSPEPPISAKAKGKRKEVNEENIVSTRRNRVRRTRSSDNLIGEAPPSKKTRSSRTGMDEMRRTHPIGKGDTRAEARHIAPDARHCAAFALSVAALCCARVGRCRV